MSRRAFTGVMIALTAMTTVLVACQETQVPTAVPIKFEPTPGPVNTTGPGSTSGPQGTSATAPAVAPVVGDAKRGQALFSHHGCSACHKTDTTTLVGPGLGGIGALAGSRIAGLSAEVYIDQSIRVPDKFLVPTFANLMPATFKDMPAAEIADLFAYLNTLK